MHHSSEIRTKNELIDDIKNIPYSLFLSTYKHCSNENNNK